MSGTTSILGQGRSGLVFKDTQQDGTVVARKVFLGDPLSKLVLYVLSGAPNPYNWHPDAIQAAHYRRLILSDLASFWFGDELRVMTSLGHAWNTEYEAFELFTAFSPGRAPGLFNPYTNGRGGEIEDLVDRIMKPLQGRLKESGFDGLVWQAGFGNPVAANNFLLESEPGSGPHWSWIDLESGVPALFPLNPVTLFTFYLPMCFKHRAALFDDVDLPGLQAYVERHQEPLRTHLAPDGYAALLENIRQLEVHQRKWKGLSRVALSINYNRHQGRLSENEAEWYLRHPLVWVLREGGRGIYRGGRALCGSMPRTAWRWVRARPWSRIFKNLVRLIFSESYRSRRARFYVKGRLHAWRERNQIDDESAVYVQEHLVQESTTPYLTDFFVHMALKPVELAFVTLVLPALLLNGWIGPVLAAFLIVWGGSISRTAYTLIRMVGSEFDRNKPVRSPLPPGSPRQHGLKSFIQNRRFMALWVGIIPTFGNLAYPVQMLYSSSTRDRSIGRFMFYDVCTRIGENAPIWGGRDTLTEHYFNRLAHKMVPLRSPQDRNKD